MPASDDARVLISAAKGRPMLSWVGKRPLREVRSFPAQLVERFAPPAPAGVMSDAVDWSDWPDRFDLSPSILERLSGEEGILAPSIDDWRAMVDSVAIDSAYDGVVFDVDLIDIPARRSDLVDGAYVLDLPGEHADRPAAVRITDMLGEEVLVVEDRA